MFDIGWTELLVVGVVALIVVGPKDLPMMFRTLGRFTGKMKGMAREFQRAMDDAADQSGVKTVAKDLRSATSSKNLGLDALNSAADRFDKWQPGMAPKTGDAAAAAAKGKETAKLAAQRAEQGEKLRAATAERAAEKAAPATKPSSAATTKPKTAAATKPKTAAEPLPKPTAPTDPA